MEYLFGMTLVNAWITYNMKNDKKVSKKEFTEALMQSLTGKSICPDSKYNDVYHHCRHMQIIVEGDSYISVFQHRQTFYIWNR